MAAQRLAQPDSNAAPQRGWFGRNWKWFVPLSILIALILGGGLGFWSQFGSQVQLRYSQPYVDALDFVQKSAKVKDALGEPIMAERWLPGGDLTDNSAQMSFNVQGPKGVAEVKSVARKIDNVWGLSTLKVQVKDGREINLTSEILGAGGGDTPKFVPQTTPKNDDHDRPPDVNLDVQTDGK